jgi:DNA-binding beta-propeller fold protein YncE
MPAIAHSIFALSGSILLASRVLAQSYTFTTFAGPPGGGGADDGVGSAARFSGAVQLETDTSFGGPTGVAADRAGNIYVADTVNHTIRKITPAGVVTTLAGLAEQSGNADGVGGAARFDLPSGIAVDSSDNAYVADTANGTIRKITPEGLVTTLAVPVSPYGRFLDPGGVAIDGDGNAYVIDTYYAIWKLSPNGLVTALAGGGGGESFAGPRGVAADRSGNVYRATPFAIEKITPNGVITTLAGSPGHLGSADGAGSDARFNQPFGVAIDRGGNVYVADSENSSIRKITPEGEVTTFAGTSGQRGGTDGTGSAARFYVPKGVSTDGIGNIYVADTGNSTIRKITPEGVVSTVAGSPSFPPGSSNGMASLARFNHPYGLAVDAGANVYVADTVNNTIRKVTPEGIVTTLAGTPGQQGFADGAGPNASFFRPYEVAVDGSGGNIYVSDTDNNTIRKITPDGVVTTFAGSPGSFGSDDGQGSAASFISPEGVATDRSGNVYVADSGNYTIRKITPSGVVSTLAGLAGNAGNRNGTGNVARFAGPSGVACDRTGNIYVFDSGQSPDSGFVTAVRKISPEGVVTTLASGVGGASSPTGVAIDGDGNVYVAGTSARNILKISPMGMVTTIGGMPGLSASSTDGTGSVARFIDPQGVAVDGSGNIYVCDSGSNKIRIGRPALADTATIDSGTGPFGATRQLNALPGTATSWQWSIVRQPARSSTALSSTLVPNPVFTPDVADVYTFRLTASNGTGSSITTVSLTAMPQARRRAVRNW